MRWSTSQSPESYLSRVNQKSYCPRPARTRGRGRQAGPGRAASRKQPRRSDSSRVDSISGCERHRRGDQTASDSEVKVKSRSFIGGIIIEHGTRRRATRTGLPSSSMLLSMMTGALVEAEVLDRVLDLAVLDVEGAVARQAR